MNNFSYRYKSMELLQFATLSDQFNPDNTISHNELRFMFDEAEKTLSCIFSVVLTDRDRDIPVLKAEMMSGFEIKEDSIEMVTKGDEIVFPANIIAHLASLTYSSLRGAMYVKSENTVFSKFILPVQNIQEQIKKPYIIKRYQTELEG